MAGIKCFVKLCKIIEIFIKPNIYLFAIISAKITWISIYLLWEILLLELKIFNIKMIQFFEW